MTVEVKDLEKSYGDFCAVNGVSFTVSPGEVLGIIGSNGAGKSTIINIIAGLIEYSSGSVSVSGLNVSDKETRNYIGYVPEQNIVYEDMTVKEYIHFFADLYNIPREKAIEVANEVFEKLELDRREELLGNMSKGMQRKVLIARSLINDPSVLIYDEPTSGLDPTTTQTILNFIEELSGDGKAIIFTAHNLSNVEKSCDKIGIMSNGKMIAMGDINSLRREHSPMEYEIITNVFIEGAVKRGEEYVLTINSMEDISFIKNKIDSKGGELIEIRKVGGTLENIFLDLVNDNNLVEV